MDAEASSGPSDEDLMIRLKGGDSSALNQLMLRWELPVKRFVFRIVGNMSEAEDLSQEVFVRVYAKRATFRTGARFSTWCFSIAANQARNQLRWWRRRPTTSYDAWTDAGGSDLDSSSAGESPSAQAMRRERVEAVKAAVSSLPIDLRTSLVLFEYEAFSVGEIAETLGCTVKAVETRLYRARQQLRRDLL